MRDQAVSFYHKYFPTLGGVVAEFTGIERQLCCFQICKVACSLAESEGLAMRPMSGLLAINDDWENPTIIGHCVLRFGDEIILDLAYAGPQSYGLPKGTPHQYYLDESDIKRSFSHIPDNIYDNLQNGVAKSELWWQEIGADGRHDILAASRFAAAGGLVVIC